ncbi:MAG: S8 family serine peptidase, partial [Chloroflexota bacterium]
MNSSRRPGALGLLSLLVIIPLLFVSTISASPPEPDREDPPTVKLPAEAQSLSPDLAAQAQSARKKHPKLDSSLVELAGEAKVSKSRAHEFAGKRSLRLSGDRVQVQITTSADKLQNAINAITAAGGEVTGVGDEDRLIQGWLPFEALENVAAQESVLYIRQPIEAQLLEGYATTEGLAPMNASAWHAAGYRGSGVKIAIIDGGFQGYTAKLGTDLPSSVTVRNFVDGEYDWQVDGTSEHGTACAEIIYDIAPQAQLYLAKVDNQLDLQEAVTWARTNQVDIISTSLCWHNLTPGDGTGFFANLVNQANANGIFWATAAGNYRERHWGGTYNDTDGDNWHDFAPGDEINYIYGADGNPWPIPAGYRIEVFLRWDDWTSHNQDYDLLLYRYDGVSLTLVAFSVNQQNGGAGQNPTEGFRYVTSGSTAYYGFAIRRWSATRPVNFEAFATTAPRIESPVYARSLGNLADSPGAVTVAALDVSSPYPQESYSSEGPTNGPGGTASGGFVKPDIAAYANVSTVSYGSGYFDGTSAATPHVAGAAALVLSAYPTYTQAQLRSFLEGRAIDMGTAGKDNQFGFGRLNLGNPPPPTITILWPPGGLEGTSVTIYGQRFTGATDVRFNGVSASFSVASDTRITATVPAGATTGPIAVTGPGGTATSATNFTVGPTTIYSVYVPL